jgi:hypothetical protein
MTTLDVNTVLANQARLYQLLQKAAKLQGAADATASISQRLNSVNSDTLIELGEVQAEIQALQLGAGPGITADFGPKSVITQLVEAERFAAKDAAIVFVQANPTCSEADAAAAWNAAALASHPDFEHVIQDGLVMSALYRANLLKAGLIPDDTWESHRAFILNTAKATLEAM